MLTQRSAISQYVDWKTLSFGLVIGLFWWIGIPQIARAQTPSDWQLQIERLRVVDAQEEEWWEDGDEPYFIMIRLRSQYEVADSTSVFWGGYLDESWAGGSHDGDENDIPQEMGVVPFTDVGIITRDDYLCRDIMPEGGGVLIVAMEHDRTPWSTVRRIMGDLQQAIDTELTNLVANAELDLYDAETDVRAALDRIIAEVSPDFWESAEIVFGIFWQPR